MKLTDKHRSMIASAFVAGYNLGAGVSLCCAEDATEACAAIIGKRKAEALRTFFYEGLGCAGSSDGEYRDAQEQYYLDKISTLEDL
jgi:hypothetical protein